MTAPPAEPDVGELRSRLRARRRSLDAATQHDHARTAAALALELGPLAAATSVGIYLADDGELDPAPLVDLLADRDVVLHLPVVGEDQRMDFRSWNPGSPLAEGRWGIPVPAEPSETRSAAELDLVIAPVVAVDRTGTRLGRGAGYYDRTLHKRIEHAGRPAIIGYAHHMQLLDEILTRHSWDVPLDALVTERDVVRWNTV